LKKRGAKSVYIPFNRNGNQRRSATITFATKEEMNAAQTKPIRFNNHLLFWSNYVERKEKSERKSETTRYKRTGDNSESTDEEIYEYNQRKESKQRDNKNRHDDRSREYYRENLIFDNQKQKKIKNEKKTQSQLQEETSHIETILGRILERLERLEEDKEKNRVNQPKRS
jgi:hypothetical protein